MDFQDISSKWRDQNSDIKNMSHPIDLNQFGLDHYQRSLSNQFKILTFMTQTQHHLEKLYQNPEQFPHNRNAHIMTFNPTKLCLSTEEDKDLVQNYINANLINLRGKRAIATQGPLANSFYNFYRMVQKYNVKSVFMLCCIIQKTKIKCDRYWPNEQTQGGRMTQKQYEITLQSQVKQNGLKIRKIHIKNKNNQFQTILTQYQITNWPDGDRPLQASKKNIDFLLKNFIQTLDAGENPVVHCSAGVGRTGTFIAMALFKKIVQTQNQISVFETVRQLRQQRWGMVYTFSQYQYLYDFVQDQINKKLNKKTGEEELQQNQV